MTEKMVVKMPVYSLYFYRYGGQFVLHFNSLRNALRYAARKAQDGYLTVYCLLMPDGKRLGEVDILVRASEYAPIQVPVYTGVETFDDDEWTVRALPDDAVMPG